MLPLNIVISGNPVTKKNSQQILVNPKTKRPFVAPSKQYTKYQRQCLPVLRGIVDTPIDEPVEVKYLFFMETHRRVDLTNLEESLDDILVHAGVLADDHSGIVCSHDGSRVYYDHDNPRVEITITNFNN